MGYKIELKNVLLAGWEEWDGPGMYDIPGKNVTLNDGTKGCILLNAEGVGVYHKSLDDINNGEGNDEGDLFIDFAETVADMNKLVAHISANDVEESKTVYNNYIEREKSYE